ncbi:MAG: hypothetical protein U9P14_02660, partial [Gemmatimonadota bacterium]|nr:hypothetical protein [Gemmatimonadota bacterium]
MRAFFSCPVVPTLGLALLLSIYCTADKQEPGHATQAPETVQGWRVLGPGGGGAQYLPTINPRDPEHVFVRCDMTGAYVTENGGESWRMFNLRTVVRDFEFDPCDPNTVYAANTGLYRSGDRGKSWRLIYPDPANIVAERMVDDHAGQYFETTDGMPGGPIDKVRVDPSDSGHLYLGLAAPNYFHSAKGRQYTGDSARLMVSHDRGASWRVLAALEGRDVLAIFPGSWWGEPGQVLVFTDRACALINETSGKATRLPLPVEQVAFADGGRGPQGVTLYI